jgi:hypothetical protein
MWRSSLCLAHKCFLCFLLGLNEAVLCSPDYFVGRGGVRAAYVLLKPLRGFVIVNVPSGYAATFSQ